jgi:hypothetical protein
MVRSEWKLAPRPVAVYTVAERLIFCLERQARRSDAVEKVERGAADAALVNLAPQP